MNVKHARFERIVVDSETPGVLNDVCLLADVNGDGHADIIIGGKRGEGNIVWYEYPDWRRHTIGTGILESGGATLDISGNGLPDLICGQPAFTGGGKELYWFENPGKAGAPWQRYLICDGYRKYHDQHVADVDGDGEAEILFASQVAEVVGYYKIPPDPRQSPWPGEYRHIVAEGLVAEGLDCADVDGDGNAEIIAGPNYFKRGPNGWSRRVINEDFQLTRARAGDLDGDGKHEIVLAEGESHPGRLAWFSAYPDFTMHLLADDLYNPHSLELADFNGNGLPDIMVAEMNRDENPNPKVIVFYNKGNGEFERVTVAEGIGSHDNRVGIIGDTRYPSIVIKPFKPGRSVEILLNRT